MINFDVSNTHHLLQILRSQEMEARQKGQIASSIPRGIDRPNLARATDAERETVIEIARLCEGVVACLGARTLQDRFNMFFLQMSYSSQWADIASEIKALREAIESELKFHHFYHYPRDKGDKVKAFVGDWGSVWPSCKLVQDEALAAVDCYALDHSTASVFHSMRVAEHGLRALAYERGIKQVRKRPIEWGNWKDIIKALGDAADAIENKRINTKGAGTKRDVDVAFYRGAIGDLDSFRVEFRNMVMHVRATYDHLQALRALERVREFMLRVSARMDENGKRHKQ